MKHATVITKCGLFVAMICVCSLIKIPLPFSPVPITLQTFAVLLAGLMLGARDGMLCATVYMMLGAIGLPVFSGMTSGFGVLLGVTGGFIWGFIPAAFAVGLCHSKLRKRVPFAVSAGLACVLGSVLIYTFGVAWFAWSGQYAVGKALTLVCVPFLPGDFVKCVAAVCVAAALERAGFAGKKAVAR